MTKFTKLSFWVSEYTKRECQCNMYISFQGCDMCKISTIYQSTINTNSFVCLCPFVSAYLPVCCVSKHRAAVCVCVRACVCVCARARVGWAAAVALVLRDWSSSSYSSTHGQCHVTRGQRKCADLLIHELERTHNKSHWGTCTSVFIRQKNLVSVIHLFYFFCPDISSWQHD